MTYDLIVRNPSPAVDVLALQYTDPGKAQEIIDSDCPTYMKANNWWTARLVDVLENLGVIYSSTYLPSPTDFPQMDTFGLDIAEVHAAEMDGGAPLSPTQQSALAAWKQAQEDVLSRADDGQRGIPDHKFYDNSGWIVTEQECRDAVGILDAVTPEHLRAVLRSVLEESDTPVDEAFIDQWMRFMRQFRNFCDYASEGHGGFAVY